jgi:hypothetical protein
VLLVGGKLVAVASAGCKIGGVMMMVRRAMATGAILGTQYSRLISSSCHLLVNIIVLTPALMIPTTRDKHRSSQLKRSRFISLDRPFQIARKHL